MPRLKLLGAAAVLLSSALASPAMAQQVIANPGYCAQFYPNANCQNNGPNSPYTGDYQRRTAYQSDQSGPYKYGKGDWSDGWNDSRGTNDSGDVAAGVVGGAIGAAGAIATAPYSNRYAARNGFVCQPGTWIKGEDGRRHICQ